MTELTGTYLNDAAVTGKEPRTCLVSVYHGGKNKARRDATVRAIEAWDAQSVRPDDAVFMELVCPGDDACFGAGDMPSWLRYVRMIGEDRNAGLFQKEAMWNICAGMTRGDKMLFLDCDSMPVGDKDHFAKLYGAAGKGLCVHVGEKLVHEGQPAPGDLYYSVFLPKSDVPRGRGQFHGIGYVIHRDDFEAMGGFNPFAINGGGDTIFLVENVNVDLEFPFAKRTLYGIVRKSGLGLMPVVVEGTTMQHNFHGLKTDRVYRSIRRIVNLFGVPTSYCHIDQSGLLAWNDPEFLLRYMNMRFDRLHNDNEIVSLIVETVLDRLQHYNEMDKGDFAYDETDFNSLV